MYKEGHAGLSFLLFSPFLLLFRSLNADTTYILTTGILMVGLSSLPDIDMEYRKYGIEHRGRTTHSLLFGIAVGVLLSILIGYAYGALGWLMGFVAGFGATASHLLADTFTKHSFKPLYPFSNREVAFRFFEASNKKANNAVLFLGLMSFVFSFLA